jgi:hypothetical protein
MKLVYLVVSHRNPDQVLRLVRALRESPAAMVVVRHDQRHSWLDAGALEQAGALPLSDAIEVAWADWSYVRMLIGALERIAAKLDPDWLTVLSGQDYPLRPLTQVEQRLSTAEHDAFIGSAWELQTSKPPPPPADEFFLRYAYVHLRTPRPLPYLPGKLKPLAYVREAPPRVGIRRPRLPFDGDLRCWVSSEWPTLNRRALRAVLRTAREEHRLIRHYRRTVHPVESFLATALMNDSSLSVSGDNHRFVRFAPQSPNPDLLTSEDLDELKASAADFARKFDIEVDGRILDLLDEVRHSRSPR